MTTKELYLAFLLLAESVALGVFLGMLDFLGFLNGEHTLNLIYLLSTFIAWHFIGLTIFLLDLTENPKETVYLTTALAFGIVFYYFGQSLPATGLAAICYFLFQIYTQNKLAARFRLFVNFSTREIVFPIIRRSFLFLLIIFLFLGFFQSSRASAKTGLVTPYLIRTISKPVILVVNKQLSAQLQANFKDQFQAAIGSAERRVIVTFVLNEALESFDEGVTRRYFGFTQDNIPLEKTIIYDNGDIDLTPVVNSMAPNIAKAVNQRLFIYLPVLPLFFGLIIVALVAPLISLSEILLLPLIRLIVTLLLKFRVINLGHEMIEKETLKL